VALEEDRKAAVEEGIAAVVVRAMTAGGDINITTNTDIQSGKTCGKDGRGRRGTFQRETNG
jgi:hypothetical protein